MNQSDWMTKIEQLAEDVCRREGCFLYDAEFIGAGKGRVLRVFIDKDNGGAGIDDCSNVSKGLNLLLDVEDVIPGGMYNLEVSTPGIDRPLKKSWHFDKVIGKKIWIKTAEALESLGVTVERMKKAKQFEQVLKGIENGVLIFDVGDGDIHIPLTAVEKSKVVFEFEKPKSKKRG